jgi:DNA/RNA endonuclease G (NUC1)
MDHTTIHPMCVSQAHLIDLHLWRSAPQNLDETRPVEILVNHGYVVGFCPERMQPVWSAYRVADSDRDVDYERPLFYHDDMRLPEEHRIGKGTFGKLGGVQLHVGHMTPNEVINRQFGRLAQMETFLMSNMSPQYAMLNLGVWSELEKAIREIDVPFDDGNKDKGHVWVIVGPVFGANPASINRGNGKYLQVPDKYFCIVVDPKQYPYDTPSKVDVDCFLIPQNAPSETGPEDYPSTLEEIEEVTNLKFFVGWSLDVPLGSVAEGKVVAPTESRLMKILQEKRVEAAEERKVVEADPARIETIEELIKALENEAAAIQIQGRALTYEELARLETIQHTISWLHRVLEILDKPVEPPQEPTLITYNITSDLSNKLKRGARTACNFWNRYVQPQKSIVIRLGKFTENSNTIACAWEPWSNNGTLYGRVEFNTKFLAGFTDDVIAGTIIHEIGHTLGFGWDEWKGLFDQQTGLFMEEAVARLGELKQMEVELEHGSGTALSHWDEFKFDKELMTGFQDLGEHVLPVTIDVMELLGHTVSRHLAEKTPLADLMQEAVSIVFSRQTEARSLDLEHFEETEIFERIPHPRIRSDV